MTDLAAVMHYTSIGTTVDDWLSESGVKSATLARRLGVTPQKLCDIIHGRRELPESMVRDLPGGLRQRVAEIMIRRHQGAIAQLRRDGG